MDADHIAIPIRKGEPTVVLLRFGVDVSSVGTFAGAIRQSPEPDPVGDGLAVFSFDRTNEVTGDVLATAPAISVDVAYTEACVQFTADGQTFAAGERIPIEPRII